MTLEVSAHYKEQWDTNVRLRFQSRGFMLKGTVMPPVRIEGTKMYFLRSGQLNATPWGGRGHAVQRQGSQDDKVEITSDEWDISYELYDRDKWMGAPAEEQTRQRQAGNGMGRKSDAIIYKAIMDAVIPTENIIGDYSTGLTPYMLMEGEARLFENFTPNDGGIYCPVPPRQYERLQTFKVFANGDWQGGGDLPLTKLTKAKTFSSTHVFMGEHDLFTPYIANTDELRIRVWHKECVGGGHIAPEEMRHEWKREGDYKRWLVMHTLDGGAVDIEPNGIVEYRIKADAPIEDEIVRTLETAP